MIDKPVLTDMWGMDAQVAMATMGIYSFKLTKIKGVFTIRLIQ